MGWQDDLNFGLAAFGLKVPDRVPLDEWAQRLGGAPCTNTVSLVALSTALFYSAEKGHNPKVNDVWDALVYCSTCISVGYSDIFARTPAGKIIGSTLMTIGPAMAASTLDGPPGAKRDATQEEILATLRQILATLQPAPQK